MSLVNAACAALTEGGEIFFHFNRTLFQPRFRTEQILTERQFLNERNCLLIAHCWLLIARIFPRPFSYATRKMSARIIC